MPEKGKRAIEITAAHAYAVVLLVECNDRCQNDIKQSCADDVTVFRLEKSVSIPAELSFGTDFLELHLRVFFDYRRKNALFHRPCARNYFPCVHFVIGRQVAGDVRGALKPG